jgi:uncharacterized protein (DUF433 family)
LVTASSLLGKGIYSIDEAALFGRVSPRLIDRWLYGSAQGESVVDPEFGDAEEKTISFLDFIQTLAIGRLRTDVRRTRIGLFGPPHDPKRQEIYICIVKEEADADKYFQITGKNHGNQLIRQVLQPYMRRLSFDEKTDLASSYCPLERDGLRVVMDPKVRFGEPYLESCGYTARTLFDAYQVERSIERAAEMYGVTGKEIELAIEYFEFLTPNAV